MSALDPPNPNSDARKANQMSELEQAVRMFGAGRATGLQRVYDLNTSTHMPNVTAVGLYDTGQELEVTEASLAVVFMAAEVYMNTANTPLTLFVNFNGASSDVLEACLYTGNLSPTDTWTAVSTPGTELVSGNPIYPASPIGVALPEDTYGVEVWGQGSSGTPDTQARNIRLWVVVL